MRKIAPFEVLINDSFLLEAQEDNFNEYQNMHTFSIVNDFEEGNWRYENFLNYIFDNMAQTALSAQERKKLHNTPMCLLRKAARNLRLVDMHGATEGSELAEILLYGIMRSYYNALPVVPKVFYKQNTQDNAKGADSVHIIIEGDEFTLWYGEAKFYTSIEDTRLSKVIDSVHETISLDKLKKENSIVTNIKDLDDLEIDGEMIARIRQVLDDRTSMDLIKPKLNIPILLLHECDITGKATTFSDEYKSEIIDYHLQRANSYFKKQIRKCSCIHLYDKITFHLMLFPIPSKKKITDAYLHQVSTLRQGYEYI